MTPVRVLIGLLIVFACWILRFLTIPSSLMLPNNPEKSNTISSFILLSGIVKLKIVWPSPSNISLNPLIS